MKNPTSNNIFKIRDTNGEYHLVEQEDLLTAAQLCIAQQLASGEALGSANTAKRYFQIQLGSLEHEAFHAIWLDSQHRVIKCSELFRGTIDSAIIYPREVVKDALACNAAAVIFGHNHPSGLAKPSEADKHITKRLKEALALVDIRLLDHLVVGENIESFAESGLL